ncbi:MAG TPA: efflux RND transporter periplasmic adaptor subunit, partial [Methylomirabilota bacterium]|nr:efflux RND transporter periplasmic adaptor subunit [Methylomirabilota bacterium]
ARARAGRTALAVLRQEVTLTTETAAAGLAQARAALVRAQAAEQQARRDAERYRWLAEQGLVELQRGEQADLAWTAARSDLAAAESALRQAEQRVADAALGPERVRAEEGEVEALESERAGATAAAVEAEAAAENARLAAGQAEAALAQAEAARRQTVAGEAQARAGLAEAVSVRGDLTIVAPSAGVVMTRTADTGEVVGAGAPLFDLVDLDRLYLRVFVAETDVGKVRLGLPAQVHVDAFPGQPFAATLRYVASRAEFTPKEIQTPDERVKLVYAVKLYLDANPEHRLTPGLPADAVIRWKEGTPWQLPRW